MLHALLHGKLEESLPESDRREDALTSTVFGTLTLQNVFSTGRRDEVDSGSTWKYYPSAGLRESSSGNGQ